MADQIVENAAGNLPRLEQQQGYISQTCVCVCDFKYSRSHIEKVRRNKENEFE